MRTLETKRGSLEGILSSLGRVVVAYSGGVDSTFLTAAAHKTLGSHAVAITAVSPALARRELADAKDLAARYGWNHRVVGTHEVTREEYARNDGDRCYWCKTELFDVLAPLARELDATIVTGTNVDDLEDRRPGLVAAAEHRVRAPLMEADLTKADVRMLSLEMGLPTHDRPASPCLASRFAYGVRVTPEGLRRVERAEEVLRDLGFGVLRVRDHGDLARIEVPVEELDKVTQLRDLIVRELTGVGFKFVTLDLQGFRSGSLNSTLDEPRFGPPIA